MKIAFLGTGMMGTGFVRGLLARGHEVTAWNRTAERARPLADEGARVAETPARAAEGAGRLYLSLSDDDAVDAALAAALPALPEAAPIVDFTTTAPIPTRARAGQLAAGGRRFLHAPVFMGPENARLAQGLMLASGPEEIFAALKPELETMTGKVWYLGPEPGRAAAFKLFGNSMFFAVVSGLADVLAVARAAGIAAPEVMELFQHLDPSRQIGFRGEKMVRGDFSPTFELSMARKDVRLAIETAAADPNARLAILPAIAARMDELKERGHGAADLGVLAVDALGQPQRERRRVLTSTPLLLVSDLRRSMDFYLDVLGYREPATFGEPPGFAMMHRDGYDLMLQRCRPEDVRPNGKAGAWDVHLRVADVQAERRAIEAAGGKLLSEPETTEYGMIEIVVEDPDGHRVCLGQNLVVSPDDVGR